MPGECTRVHPDEPVRRGRAGIMRSAAPDHGETEIVDADGRTHRGRMLAGDPYLADDPEIVRDSRRAIGLCERYDRTSVLEQDERRRILAELLGTAGEGIEIRPPFHCDLGYQLHSERARSPTSASWPWTSRRSGSARTC